MLHGVRSPSTLKGFTITDGEEVMEKTRAIKGVDEIKLRIRCAQPRLRTGACTEMEPPDRTRHGPKTMSWAVLHAENIKFAAANGSRRASSARARARTPGCRNAARA